jgi:hypothetical protein
MPIDNTTFEKNTREAIRQALVRACQVEFSWVPLLPGTVPN